LIDFSSTTITTTSSIVEKYTLVYELYDDDEIVDDIDFKKFQDHLAESKTREELEKFFDVKTFIKWQA